jgi:hypothetical protein
MGALGYGEFRPVSDNLSAEGRAKNRRIAIIILPEQLLGSDVVDPGPETSAVITPGQVISTNGAPRITPLGAPVEPAAR